MRISTKGHYGIHAILDLARSYGKGPILMRELTQRHGHSEKYLEQLLRDLRRQGIVQSSRGVNGGYWLARDPAQVSLLEVIETLEGGLLEKPSGCMSDCGDIDSCATLEIWFKGLDELRTLLAGRSLAEHLERQDELEKKSGKKACRSPRKKK